MNHQKPTVTIGIPAFNEQSNIACLLKSLTGQKQTNFEVKTIFVASDGSTDQTVKEAKSVKNQAIRVLDFKDRQGRANRQTFMMRSVSTDIFVLIDADTAILDCKFLHKLLQPIINSKADLVSGNLQPLPAENFFEKVLEVSMEYKRRIFEKYRNGQNMFTCYGPIRAFSKAIYSQIEFKKSVAEDMYSYFYCLYSGFKYAYVKDAFAYFRLPTNIADYRKQSTRYWSSADLMEEFGHDFVCSQYLLPKKLFVIQGLVTFIHHPVYAPIYPFLTLLTRIESVFKKDLNLNTWAIANSSKVVGGRS